MKPLRLALLLSVILTLGGPAFGGGQSLSPETAQALLQAKSVYLVTGHVHFYKFKHLVKAELVDSTPFAEPTQQEMEKWNRFQLVSDPKQADLIIRVYANDRPAPIVSSNASGSVVVGTTYTILDVVQPSSRRILWYDVKTVGRSWSTKTEVAGLVKDLRNFMDEQATSVQSAPAAATPSSAAVAASAAAPATASSIPAPTPASN